MSKMLIIAAALLCSGCATVGDILEIVVDEPVPVCDRDAAGVNVQGLGTCVKFSDGSYRWE